MDKQRPNILQIQKYLNGELDAKAMHQLEREAQHDPFLMDALEGYQMAAGNQQTNLDMLAKRLRERTGKKPSRIIPWTTIAIAAGVVGFMVVVGLLYKGNDDAIQPKVAEVKLVLKPQTDTTGTTTAIARLKANDLAKLQVDKKALNPALRNGPTTMATDKVILNKRVAVSSGDASLAEVAMSPPLAAKADSGRMPLDEMIIGAISAPKTDTVDMPLTVAIKKRAISQPLPGKADGVNTEPKRPTSAYDLNKYLPGYFPNTVANNNNVLPVPGITAKADNKATTALTNNANGIYASPTSSQNLPLQIGYSGFANLKTNANADSVNIAGLNTKLPAINNSVANNAAITRNTVDDEDTDPTTAHPAKGWMVFRVYIAKNSYLPAGEKPGVVEVKFTVAADGKLSNINITQSLNAATDKKAIALITNGPKWKGNANGKPQEITQSIGFVNKK
ncbi:energy transducer TonB [Mucilaginibacter psychrotolerans]|uniref:TonB C-terminal domain-containing protein n=1 Tax=Mucilaginibacter psychrotolerans TaxID=1524096 RepID=A0A4Y8S4P4_9SPHI|nr:energy transducer TonB [Mucilaginibacter psychrotolerans]TFF33540.1 hypothetical protein E2R66_25540 [Mucilaginibacter psychrotolerans]